MSISVATFDNLIGNSLGVATDVVKRAITHQEYEGDPTNNLTPRQAGDLCHDTTNNDWYRSHGTAKADWKIDLT